MTVTGYAVSWWEQFILVCLVLTGAGVMARGLWRGLGQVRDWWHDRRRDRFDEDDFIEVGPPWAPDDLPPLPPERTWEQMTSLPLTVADAVAEDRARWGGPSPWAGKDSHTSAQLGAERERRPPWWEVQQRAAYEAMGFDYPSGLMARVRELTP